MGEMGEDGKKTRDGFAHGGVYEVGAYKTQIVRLAAVQKQASRCLPVKKMMKKKKRHGVRVVGQQQQQQISSNSPPKPLLIAAPKAEGKYPVVQFHHGFTLQNNFYSQLIAHLASHGFIVVAPQMYTISGSDTTREIEDAAAILNWMPTGLESALLSDFPNTKPDFSKVALVGHSRGGLGSKKSYLFPPCAPDGVSHREFFFDSSAPAFHFVAKEYGHMDFLDDDCKGAQGKLSYCVCKNGPSRTLMRRFAGGILAAFLQAALLNNTTSFDAALAHPELAPVLLERPESYGKLPQNLNWQLPFSRMNEDQNQLVKSAHQD
ncbi:hypothetical protein CY35_08G107400 [Sphagnum magellanicum]|nr:hypothetical protein CY35_08G107400 [Sphagnum magellanicum]